MRVAITMLLLTFTACDVQYVQAAPVDAVEQGELP